MNASPPPPPPKDPLFERFAWQVMGTMLIIAVVLALVVVFG